MYIKQHVTTKGSCACSVSRWVRGSAKNWSWTEQGLEHVKKTLSSGLDKTSWAYLILVILQCGLIHNDEDIIEKHTDHVHMPRIMKKKGSSVYFFNSYLLQSEVRFTIPCDKVLLVKKLGELTCTWNLSQGNPYWIKIFINWNTWSINTLLLLLTVKILLWIILKEYVNENYKNYKS